MNKPRLLDLFCGAGGCSVGYAREGFEVVGVDINPQPHYPFEFHQADALTYPLEGFDCYHASPPCQDSSRASIQWRKAGKVYHQDIPATRKRLIASGKPWVMENVVGAPLLNPVLLNGAMFQMKIRRNRLFETSFEMPLVLLPKEQAAHFRKMGRPIIEGDILTPVGHFSNVPYARRQMGIDWMNQAELAQAIPPAYTEYIGKYLMQAVLDSLNVKGIE